MSSSAPHMASVGGESTDAASNHNLRKSVLSFTTPQVAVQAIDPFSLVPDEVPCEILSWLPYEDVMNLGASCKQLNNICSGSIGIWSLFFAKSRKYIPISRIVALANHRHIEYLDMSRVVVVEDQPLSSPGGLAADGESGNNENDVEHENNDEADENDNENDDDEEAELAQQVAAKVGLGLSARGGTYLAVRSASLFKKVKVLVFRHQHLGDHAAVKLLVDAMSDLEYLDISSPMSGVNSAMMTELAKLPNLCTLKARRTAFSNGALSVLTDFKSLIVLDVCGSDAVSDSVIGKIISSMTNLEQLCLSECPVTDVCCPIIAAKLPNLIALRFAYTYATQQGIGEFSKLKNLELLDIRGSNIAEFAMQELCDRLEELHSLRDLMWDHKHTQNTLSRLASLNFLRNVSIKNVDNEGLMLIRNFPRLRTLSISEYLGDDSSMMSMSEMTDMEELSITVAPFIGFSGLSELRNMRMLQSLMLCSLSILDDECVEMIARSFPYLKKLALRDCPAGDPGIMSLSSLKQLEYLAVGSPPNTSYAMPGKITSAGLSIAVQPLRRLQHLEAAGININTDEDKPLKFLASLVNLQTLILTSVQPELLDEHLLPLLRLPSLSRLDLSYNAELCGSFVSQLPKLTYLAFWGTSSPYHGKQPATIFNKNDIAHNFPKQCTSSV